MSREKAPKYIRMGVDPGRILLKYINSRAIISLSEVLVYVEALPKYACSVIVYYDQDKCSSFQKFMFNVTCIHFLTLLIL